MTTQELLDKIEKKAKNFRFEVVKKYRPNSTSVMPFEEVIVFSKEYPDFLFLVHKNYIFDRNSYSDTSYEVFSFDKQGNYVRKESVEELGSEFFKNMKVLKVV